MGESKLGKYLGGMVGHMTGAGVCYGVWLGEELGLYRVDVRGRPDDRGGGGCRGQHPSTV